MELLKLHNPKILHVIDSLGRGGAETMMSTLLPLLSVKYEIVVVILQQLEDEFMLKSIKVINLDYNGKLSVFRTVRRLRKVINEEKPDLIRSQLYISTLIARLANNNRLPHVFSIHSILSKDAFNKNFYALILERLTYSKQQVLIAVSQQAQIDYNSRIKVKGPQYLLYNFVNAKYFSQKSPKIYQSNNLFKLITVGNLKAVKNHRFMVMVINKLVQSGFDVTLDIIGFGPLEDELNHLISLTDAPVKLLGSRSNVYELLPNYHAFFMASEYEGFGISVAEAMAVGLPLVLNDLEVFHEVSNNYSVFYKTDNVDSAANCIIELIDNYDKYLYIASKAKKFASMNYSSASYVNRLVEIYNNHLYIDPKKQNC